MDSIQNTAKHTPAPWQVTRNDPLLVCDADGEKRGCAPIALMQGKRVEAKANARHIVKCVNTHDELVALLERYVAQDAITGATENGLYRSAIEAIAKATGK